MEHETTARCMHRMSASPPGWDRLRRFGQALTLLLLITAWLAPGRAQTDLETAIQLFNQGQRETALAEIHRLADAGDTQAKYTLGVIYAQGQGVPPDLEQAVGWFREAANEGYSSAQYSLGMAHAGGLGVPQDLVRGLMWLNVALEDRNSQTAFRLQIVSMAALLKKSMTPEQIAQARELAAAWKPGMEMEP